jgi:hypothetical protein
VHAVVQLVAGSVPLEVIGYFISKITVTNLLISLNAWNFLRGCKAAGLLDSIELVM